MEDINDEVWIINEHSGLTAEQYEKEVKPVKSAIREQLVTVRFTKWEDGTQRIKFLNMPDFFEDC